MSLSIFCLAGAIICAGLATFNIASGRLVPASLGLFELYFALAKV